MAEKRQIVRELFRPLRKNFPTRHVTILGLDDLLQVDLIEMQDIQEHNEGYRYIFAAINAFSKFAYCIPVKNKSASTCADVCEKILDSSKEMIGREFKNLQSDQGAEFAGKFSVLMRKRNINHYHTYSMKKASIVERFIRTIKSKIYQEFTLKSTLRFLDFLPKLVHTYNYKTVHRTTKKTPFEASQRKEERHLLNSVYNVDRPRVKPKFKINQPVRISRYKNIFGKSYTHNFSPEIFFVHLINHKFPNHYILRDGKGEIIKGGFYEVRLAIPFTQTHTHTHHAFSLFSKK